MEEQRNDLQSSSASESSGMHKVFVFNCPYLGTLEDSDTSLAYPAVANYCFRVDSPTEVDLSHQESYCLSDQHHGCHVFQMANAAKTDAEPVVVAAAPKKRQRRLSLYALPIILVLILLAAIIWWPAPGTTIQDSLVRGAQGDREVSGGVSLNGKPESAALDSSGPNESVIPQNEAEAPSGPSLNSSGNEDEAVDKTKSSDSAVDSSSAVDEQNGSEAVQLADEAEQRPAVSSAVSEANSDEGPTESMDDLSEEPADEVSADAEISESEASADEAVVTSSESTETSSETAEEASDASAIVDVEVEDLVKVEKPTTSAAVVTGDLPIISTDETVVTTVPVDTAAEDEASELVLLIGPANSSSLSLGDGSEETNALAVYQEPAGAISSLIESRQFVTVLDRDESGAWINVLLGNGIEGWISASESGAGASSESRAITTETAVPAATSFPVVRSAYVDTGLLNVRSGPGVQYEAFTTISKGQIVGLIGRRALGPWVRIRLDSGLEGWVNSSLLAPIE